MIRRIGFFVLQFLFVTAAIIGGCAAWIIYHKGMAYAETAYFIEDMQPVWRAALAASSIIFLVVICYRLTRRELREDTWFDPDIN